MQQTESNNLPILCMYCKEYSHLLDPLSIYQGTDNRYYIKGECYICHNIKNLLVKKDVLPEEIINSESQIRHELREYS